MPDPFSTFGLPRRFDLELEDLRQRFLSASAQHHPDRFTDPLEQADAAEQSAQINHAYQVLSDPESRAKALLALHGGADASDEKSLPPALLMQVMEVREELDQAIADQNDAELARLHAWATGEHDQHLANLARLFAVAEPDTAAVRLELNALRYIRRMLEQMPD